MALSSVEVLVQRLVERCESISLAESCTGGLLSSQFAAVSGVSQVYRGSVVAYSNDIKEKLLGVPSHLLKSVGAVSLPVARRMARGVREEMESTWAVSITGIAGPSGGSEEKPVGTVCFAVVGPGVEEAVQERFDGDRLRIQALSAEYAVKFLLKHVTVD